MAAAPRQLSWDGCINVRDLGGLPLADGGLTRFGAIIRADNVRRLSDEGWRALEDYGIRTIVDLRWQDELDEDPSREIDLKVVHIPLLEDLVRVEPVDALAAEIDDPVVWRAATYLQFLTSFPRRFGQAVEAIADAEPPVLVHCAGGVDRTGLVAALLLRVAGVGVDDVAADFALSGPNWAPRMGAWLADAPDDAERRRRQMLGDIRAEAMVAVLREIDAEGYLRDAGVGDQTLARIRERLHG